VFRLASAFVIVYTLCPAVTLVDNEVAELARRVESLSSKESFWPRVDTLQRTADLLKAAKPAKSAELVRRAAEMLRSHGETRPEPLLHERRSLEHALSRHAGGDALEQAAETFLQSLEHSQESPDDYWWFVELRRRYDIIKGGDNPSVRAREALRDLAELVRTDLTIELTTLDGQPVKFESLRGRPAILSFWATWCAPCVAEIPILERFWSGNKASRVAFAAITDEPAETVRRFLSDQRVDYPVLLDPRRASFRRWRVETMPALRVLDKTGRLRARGTLAGQRELERLLRAAEP
jgi:thiol-disulfide isomerase/thioredoxin